MQKNKPDTVAYLRGMERLALACMLLFAGWLYNNISDMVEVLNELNVEHSAIIAKLERAREDIQRIFDREGQ